MSVLPLTPSVIQGLRNDFRQGTWSPTTQQFFQQLFLRVGGSTADTNAELAQAVELLNAAVLTLQEAVALLEAEVDGLSTDVGLSPMRHDLDLPDALVGLIPREEWMADDFDLGWPPCQ